MVEDIEAGRRFNFLGHNDEHKSKRGNQSPPLRHVVSRVCLLSSVMRLMHVCSEALKSWIWSPDETASSCSASAFE